MFQTLQDALQNGEKLALSVERKGDGLVVLVAFQGGPEGASRTPLLLKGIGQEIDAVFEQQILTFSEVHSGLISTLDAAKAVMQDAQKEASKKASAKPAASAASVSTPAVSGSTPPKAKTPSKEPAKPDPLLDELF